jgi:hypothetical protein
MSNKNIENKLVKRKNINLKEEEEKNQEKTWHTQQEAILKRWSEIGSSYRFMHDRAFTKYSRQNFRFALPVIIISTITGTANFAQGSFPEAWRDFVPLFIGFLNLSAGLITTIAQFLRVSELLEGHRAASIAYSKFSRNISVELSLPHEDRSTGGTEFVNTCRNELDRLIEQSPNIPIEIINEFGAKFKDTTFMKPEILNITDVQVYRDDRREKAKRKMQELKEAEMLRATFLKEEALRRKSILSEYMTEQRLQEEKIKRDVELKKKAKKEGVSVATVQNKMKKLLDKLHNNDLNNDVTTPSSSENSVESDGDNIKLPVLSSIIGTGNDNINIVISDDDRNVVSLDSEQDIENALGSINRIPTPTLLLDPSGNNTD